MTKRYAWLIALGAGAALCFAVATLPASLLVGRLGRYGVESGGASGTVWSGAASGLTWRGTVLGDLEWKLSPLALLRGHAAGHARLARLDGSAESDFDVSSAPVLRLEHAHFAAPIESLASLPLGVPRGWQGRVTGTFEEAVIEGGRIVTLRGVLDLDDLLAPPPRNARFGGFRAVFPHPQGTPADGSVTALVTDKQGPFAVNGRLTLRKDRSFLLEGTLAPRGPLPADVERALQFLGPADASGRRPFSVSGTL